MFVLQNEITSRIANALKIELIAAEAARPIEHPDTLDYILRGRAALNEGATPGNLARAADLFEHALTLDPQSVEAKGLLAVTLANRVVAGMTNTRGADIARAKELVDQVMATSPRSTLAHFAKGQLLRAEGRCADASPEYEMVIGLDRNAADAFFALGVCKVVTGSIEEAIPLEEQAIRLSPLDPAVFTRYTTIGQVHLLQSRTSPTRGNFEGVTPYFMARLRSARMDPPDGRGDLQAAGKAQGCRPPGELGRGPRLGRAGPRYPGCF